MQEPTKPAAGPSGPAAKKYMGLLDEFSHRLNLWGLVPTYGVADISELGGTAFKDRVRDLFRTYGIVIVRRTYSPEDSARLYEVGKAFTGLNDLDVTRVAKRKIKHFVGGTPAVTDARFWPFITHPNMKAIVREVLGDAQATEFGTSMAAHYSARGLHRDFPTWFKDPGNSYNLVRGVSTCLRVLAYPTRQGMPAGTFGFIPFSHRKDLYDKQAARIGLKRPFEWYDQHRQLARDALAAGQASPDLEEMDSLIMWVHLEAGDVLLLDARMQHGGDFIVGPRYLFVMSFGPEDAKSKSLLKHRWNTQLQVQELNYYEHLHGEGLCSLALLNECRQAAARRSST